MTTKIIKVIFDTNVWISFLIGKKLSVVKSHIENSSIKIIITNQLLQEIINVTARPKLQKYFSVEIVNEFILLLETIAINVAIKPTHFISRDKKDNFLFDLIDFSKADYLVTGDNDLLEHYTFKTAKILTANDFEKAITIELS